MKLPSLSRVALICVVIAPACSQDEEIRHRELTEISARHNQDLFALKGSQGAFTHTYPAPRQLDFGQDGTILIHENALDGPLEHEQLWMQYTWVNTTSHTIDKARITIRLLDPAGVEIKHVEMSLQLPLSFRFMHHDAGRQVRHADR